MNPRPMKHGAILGLLLVLLALGYLAYRLFLVADWILVKCQSRKSK